MMMGQMTALDAKSDVNLGQCQDLYAQKEFLLLNNAHFVEME